MTEINKINKIIEDMKTIKAKTVITPTEDRTNILLDVKNNNIFFTTSEKMKPLEYQHLHITTDEKIKVGDYITDGYKVWKWNDDSSLLGRRKVVATNDSNLGHGDEFGGWYPLPQPQESFIKRYCEAGDIDEVNIKMEDYCPKIACNNDLCHDGCKEKKSRIKINPDNTINIHSSNEYVTPQD